MQDGLVEQAQRGDAEAFDSLARMVGDRCLAIAVRILRDIDLAEDAVQAALITAWTELRTLRDPSRFEPWLHRILTNACYAEARRRKRWSEGLRILPVAGAYRPDDYLTVDDRDLLSGPSGGSPSSSAPSSSSTTTSGCRSPRWRDEPDFPSGL